MTLSDDIRAMQKNLGKEGAKSLQWVLDELSARGKRAGSMARKKVRGDSAYYARLANKRWKK